MFSGSLIPALTNHGWGPGHVVDASSPISALHITLHTELLHHPTYGTFGGAFLPCGVLSLETRQKKRVTRNSDIRGGQKATYQQGKCCYICWREEAMCIHSKNGDIHKTSIGWRPERAYRNVTWQVWEWERLTFSLACCLNCSYKIKINTVTMS